MSRIGKKPITVPSGVDVTIDGSHVAVKGPKGSLELDVPEDITVSRDGDDDRREPPRRRARPPGAARPHPVAGQQHGASASPRGSAETSRSSASATAPPPQGQHRIELQVGYSHPVPVQAPEGSRSRCPRPTRITVRGIDKQLVGQVAADIRKIRKPEPYKGKGIRYVDERVLRKAGKSAK